MPKFWLIDIPIVSTSFVTLDKISPNECLSKYFNGSLFIFFDMPVLKFFASLFAVVAMIKLVRKLRIALVRYSPTIKMDILITLSKSIPVISPAVIVSVRSDSLFGPIIEHIELAIPNTIAAI